MCEFISWIEVNREGKKEILYLDDELLAEKRTKKILEGSKDNDFLGHHAIRAVWDLKTNEGVEGEVPDFWNTGKLPQELQQKLKDFPSFKKNFGKMFENYAQSNDLRYVVKNASENWKELKDLCQTKLIAPFLKKVTTETLKITARYHLSIQELKEAAKFDGYVSPDVTDEHFPEKKGSEEKNKEAILVCLGAYATGDDAEAVMKRLHLRPGTVKELLSFTIDHPDKQREFPIIEVGSDWLPPGGHRRVAFLRGWDGGRDLYLDWREDGWDGSDRFLAFRES